MTFIIPAKKSRFRNGMRALNNGDAAEKSSRGKGGVTFPCFCLDTVIS